MTLMMYNTVISTDTTVMTMMKGRMGASSADGSSSDDVSGESLSSEFSMSMN